MRILKILSVLHARRFISAISLAILFNCGCHLQAQSYMRLGIADDNPRHDTTINGYVNASFFKDYTKSGVWLHFTDYGEVRYSKWVDWNPYKRQYQRIERKETGKYQISNGVMTIRWQNGIVDKGACTASSNGNLILNFYSGNKLVSGKYIQSH